MTATTGFRADIEGLRGIAVLMVVLYHAGVPGFSGGFVGVDVFFVLSGFLITGLLVDERAKSGAVHFGQFFARRVRRLLPASMLVFVATVLMAVAFMPLLDAVELYGQARWVALFGANLWLARDATDYLGSTGVSPFQQYWSLALEEQFYLVWPFLLAGLAWGKPRREVLLRRLLVGITALIVGSFVLAVVWTRSRQPWAFFLLPARAWELGAGGLLAVGIRSGFKLPTSLTRPAGWLGVAALVLATASFSESTTFPGWTALLPVIGTVAVLASSVRALAWSPLRWLGKYSYGIYLWHWPMLVITESAAGTDVGLPVRLVLVAVSVAAAVLSFELVEHRVRFAPKLVTSSARSAALGVGLVVVALSATVLISPAGIIAFHPVDSGRQALQAGEPSSFVPVGVRPPLIEASEDTSGLPVGVCQLSPLQSKPADCAFGDGLKRVVLFGDSHIAHWFPAVKDTGWGLQVHVKQGCAVGTIDYVYKPVGGRFTECEEWREEVLRRIEADPPDLVVIGQYSNYYVNLVGAESWIEGLGDVVERLARVTNVVVLRDTPDREGVRHGQHIQKCLIDNLDDVAPCSPNNSDTEDLAVGEEREVESAGGAYADPNAFVCQGDRCPAVVGDIIVYRDTDHLTATFVRSVAKDFRALIETSQVG